MSYNPLGILRNQNPKHSSTSILQQTHICIHMVTFWLHVTGFNTSIFRASWPLRHIRRAHGVAMESSVFRNRAHYKPCTYNCTLVNLTTFRWIIVLLPDVIAIGAFYAWQTRRDYGVHTTPRNRSEVNEYTHHVCLHILPLRLYILYFYFLFIAFVAFTEINIIMMTIVPAACSWMDSTRRTTTPILMCIDIAHRISPFYFVLVGNWNLFRLHFAVRYGMDVLYVEKVYICPIWAGRSIFMKSNLHQKYTKKSNTFLLF